MVCVSLCSVLCVKYYLLLIVVVCCLLFVRVCSLFVVGGSRCLMVVV